MSDLLKQQLKHCEKNLIDLEDTSDYNSGSDLEKIEEDKRQIKDIGDTLQLEQSDMANHILNQVNNANLNRPSIVKRRQQKKEITQITLKNNLLLKIKDRLNITQIKQFRNAKNSLKGDETTIEQMKIL